MFLIEYLGCADGLDGCMVVHDSRWADPALGVESREVGTYCMYARTYSCVSYRSLSIVPWFEACRVSCTLYRVVYDDVGLLIRGV